MCFCARLFLNKRYTDVYCEFVCEFDKNVDSYSSAAAVLGLSSHLSVLLPHSRVLPTSRDAVFLTAMLNGQAMGKMNVCRSEDFFGAF